LEWTIDNCGDLPIFQESGELPYAEYLKLQSNGWGHPSPQMMEKFVREELMKMIRI
jgi:hypothetical protein